MTTLAVLVAVLLLGIPGTVLGVSFLWRSANSTVESRAAEISTFVERRYEEGNMVSQVLLERYASREGFFPAHIELDSKDGSLEAGVDLDDVRVISASVTAPNATVTVSISRDDVMVKMAYAAGIGLAAILVSFGAGVVVALSQSRKVSAPLIYLAAAAEQVGSGQTRPQMEKSGIEEIDLVYDELGRTANRMAGRLSAERQFSADASHQLRSPLAALSMRLEEIQYLSDDPEVSQEAGTCLEQVERLAGVVEDLLSQSRSGGGAGTEAVQLQQILDQQREEWSHLFDEAGRELTFDNPEDLAVLSHPGTLSQIIATLIENSLRYGAGTTSVAASKSGRGVVIHVSDEGEGVATDNVDSIFEKGFSTGGSTGIGLPLAKDLAEADGGRLELSQARPPVFALALNAVPQALNPDRVLPAGSIISVGSRRRRK